MLTVVLTGPTCSGKGSVAYHLAQRLDAEIVSLDSMKVYRRMDIGTAKPPAERRRRVPYHLLDVVDPNEEYSLGRYVREALATAAAIFGRRRHTIVAGGTPLYLRGLLRGFCPAPGGDPAVRQRLADRIHREGLAALYEELRRVDQDRARTIHPRDRKRIVRALEVYMLTGRPFTEFWRNSVLRLPPSTYLVFGLSWPRDQLYERIDRRVLRMVQAGLFAEAEAVAAAFSPLSRTARHCIGYREIWDGRGRGEHQAAIVERIQRSTRHFARKQGTWFRSFPEIRWLPALDRQSEEIAREIARHARNETPALPG